jgi:hypothetical protein
MPREKFFLLCPRARRVVVQRSSDESDSLLTHETLIPRFGKEEQIFQTGAVEAAIRTAFDRGLPRVTSKEFEGEYI